MTGRSRVIYNSHGRIIYSSRVKDNRALDSLNKIRDGWDRISCRIGDMLQVLVEKIRLLKLKLEDKGYSQKGEWGGSKVLSLLQVWTKPFTAWGRKEKFAQASMLDKKVDFERKVEAKDRKIQELNGTVIDLKGEKNKLEKKLIQIQAENEELIKNTDELTMEFNQKVSKLQLDLAASKEEREVGENTCKLQQKKLGNSRKM